jgi:hypothetical protein
MGPVMAAAAYPVGGIGRGSLGQFDEKWGRVVNKGGFGAIFSGLNAPKCFGAVVGALF